MKRIIWAVALALLISAPSYAKHESGSGDAESVVLYGRDASGVLTPINIGASGGVSFAGDLLDNERLTGSNIDRYIDFNDNEFTTSIGGGLYLKNSNVWFLEENEDIDAFIASDEVADGDVVYLASGTYTVTAEIDIGKSIALIGQGQGKTTISTATDTLNIIDINIDNVTVKNLSITSTGDGTQNAIDATASAGTMFTNIVVENVKFSMTGDGGQRAINLVDACGTFRNNIGTITSGDSAAVGFRSNPASTQEAVCTNNIYSNQFVTSAGGSTDYGFQFTESTATNATTYNLYDCVGIATESAAATSAGLHATAATGAEIVVNVYGGYFAGTDDDLIQVSTAVVNVYETTLAQYADTTGTITYLGDTVQRHSYLDGGAAAGQLTLDGDTGGCLMFQDTDNAGWSECDLLNGTMSCSTDADGICD